MVLAKLKLNLRLYCRTSGEGGEYGERKSERAKGEKQKQETHNGWGAAMYEYIQ